MSFIIPDHDAGDDDDAVDIAATAAGCGEDFFLTNDNRKTKK